MIVIYAIFRRDAYIDFIYTTYSSYGIITLSVCMFVYIHVYMNKDVQSLTCTLLINTSTAAHIRCRQGAKTDIRV